MSSDTNFKRNWGFYIYPGALALFGFVLSARAAWDSYFQGDLLRAFLAVFYGCGLSGAALCGLWFLAREK
jgi:hypothetical protein